MEEDAGYKVDKKEIPPPEINKEELDNDHHDERNVVYIDKNELKGFIVDNQSSNPTGLAGEGQLIYRTDTNILPFQLHQNESRYFFNLYYQQINITHKETIEQYTPNTYIIHQGLVEYMMLTNRLSHINNLNKPLFKSETSCSPLARDLTAN